MGLLYIHKDYYRVPHPLIYNLIYSFLCVFIILAQVALYDFHADHLPYSGPLYMLENYCLRLIQFRMKNIFMVPPYHISL